MGRAEEARWRSSARASARGRRADRRWTRSPRAPASAAARSPGWSTAHPRSRRRRGPPSSRRSRNSGYVPNRAARALVTQRTDSVALVVSESEERVFGEPFFAGIIRGINSMLLETPLQLWLAMAQSKAERERVEHHLTPQHVDGVLLMSLHGDDPLPTLLAQRGLPVVRLWPARRPRQDRRRPDELRGRRQRGRRPGRGGPPARPGPPAGRRHRRPAGHGRGRGPARRLPAGAAGRRPAGGRVPASATATSPRPAAPARCGRCSTGTPTSTPSSPPPT